MKNNNVSVRNNNFNLATSNSGNFKSKEHS